MRSLLFFCLLLFSGRLYAQYPSQNMTLLANWDVDTLPTVGSAQFQYNDIWGYTDCEGNEYALLGSEGAVHFIQLLPDNTVVERAFYQPGDLVLWRDMKTYHDRAFSMCDSCDEGLVMYDLSALPDTVTVLEQNTESFGSAHNLYVDEAAARLYVVGSNEPDADLFVYDLENLGDTLPDPVRIKLPGGYVHDIHVSNDRAYASHGVNGLYIYDITEPDTFALLGIIEDYPQAGYNHSSWPSADGQFLVMADETFNTSLKMVDISDPADAQLTDLFRSALLAPADTATIVHNPFIRGDYVIASYYHDGVQIFDWSDPTDVQRIAYFDTEPDNTNYGGFTGNWGVYPFFPSGRIIASDMHNGLFVLSADSLMLEPSTLLRAAPPVDTLGRTTLCAGESTALAVALPPDAGVIWQFGERSFATDTLVLDTAGLLFGEVSQRHCRYPLDSVVLRRTIFPDLPLDALETAFCPGDSIVLDLESADYEHLWVVNGDTLNVTGPQISLSDAATVTVSLLRDGCVSEPEDIEVAPHTVVPPTITVQGDTLLVADGGVGFQWYVDGMAIAGATESSYAFPPVTTPTAYFVDVVDENGCTSRSEPVQLVVSTTGLPASDYRIFPNPFDTYIRLDLPGTDVWDIRLIDALGRTVLRGTIASQRPLFTAQLARGSYWMRGVNRRTGASIQTPLRKH